MFHLREETTFIITDITLKFVLEEKGGCFYFLKMVY